MQSKLTRYEGGEDSNSLKYKCDKSFQHMKVVKNWNRFVIDITGTQYFYWQTLYNRSDVAP